MIFNRGRRIRVIRCRTNGRSGGDSQERIDIKESRKESRMNTKKFIAVCIQCLYLAIIPVIAQENDTSVDETVAMATPTTKPTAVPND